MSFSAVLNVLRTLVWETFWQAVASRIFWVMLVFTAACVVFCLGIHVTGQKGQRMPGGNTEFIRPGEPGYDPNKPDVGPLPITGEVSLAFGAVRGIPVGRDVEDVVHFVHFILSAFVAGTLGIVLTLVWTAGFLPAFLEPQAASVLLTKPVPRWLVLLGKFIGLILVVGIQAGVFAVGTWAALGIATGVWSQAYLLSIPLLMLQFAFFYSVSMFLAVATRSTIVCMVGIVLFWLLCTAVNTGHIQMLADHASGAGRWLVDSAYWVLPKPMDLHKMLSDVLDAERFAAPVAAVRNYNPDVGSLLSQAAFAVVMLVLAALDVVKVDY